MVSTARWPAALWRVPAECAWGGCGRPAGVDPGALWRGSLVRRAAGGGALAMSRWGDTVTLGRREAAAVRRLLRDVGQGAVTVHRTMERRDFRAIAWLLREASQNGALPGATRQAAGDWFAWLEDRIG